MRLLQTVYTEKILRKVDKILENLADSPQIIVLIVVSGMVSIASVFGVLLGPRIIKLIKEMRNERRDNTMIIKDLFSERWDRAEAMFKNQASEINIPSAREPRPTSEVLTFTVNGARLTNENLHGRNIGFRK